MPRSIVCGIFVSTLALTTVLVGCDAKPAESSDTKKGDTKKGDAGKSDAGGKADAGGAEKAGDAGTKKDPASTVDVKVGDSCEGISASDGLIACDGNKVIFCSSHSAYKWTMTQECAEGTKCVAQDKGAGCQ